MHVLESMCACICVMGMHALASYVCMHLRHMYAGTCVNACMHKHKYTHHARVQMNKSDAHICVYVCVCVCLRIRACVCVCVCTHDCSNFAVLVHVPLVTCLSVCCPFVCLFVCLAPTLSLPPALFSGLSCLQKRRPRGHRDTPHPSWRPVAKDRRQAR